MSSFRVTSNAKDVTRRIKNVAKKLSREVLKEVMFAALEEVGNVSAAKYFRRTSIKEAEKFEAIAGKLTNRTLRLIGSVSGNYRFTGGKLPPRVKRLMETDYKAQGQDFSEGKRESIREVRVGKGRLEGIIGSKVPYAEIHEFGGTIKTVVTGKMRKFFWAMYFQTGDDKWKGMALSGKEEFTSTIGARPYLRPARDESKETIHDMFVAAVHATWEKEKI